VAAVLAPRVALPGATGTRDGAQLAEVSEGRELSPHDRGQLARAAAIAALCLVVAANMAAATWDALPLRRGDEFRRLLCTYWAAWAPFHDPSALALGARTAAVDLALCAAAAAAKLAACLGAPRTHEGARAVCLVAETTLQALRPLAQYAAWVPWLLAAAEAVSEPGPECAVVVGPRWMAGALALAKCWWLRAACVELWAVSQPDLRKAELDHRRFLRAGYSYELKPVSRTDDEAGEEPHCPVCLDTAVDPVQLRCGHVSCRACITPWLARQGADAACPVCRQPARPPADATADAPAVGIILGDDDGHVQSVGGWQSIDALRFPVPWAI